MQVFAILLCLGGLPAAEPAKLSQAEAERLIFQCWKEVRYQQNGNVIEVPGHLYGHKFDRNEYYSWPRGGEFTGLKSELKIQIIVNAKTHPIRLDIVSDYPNGKRYASPGIVMFEKDNIIWVKAGVEQKSELSREDGEYKTRPTGFEATKENHYVKRVMVRCKYLDE
jgi:hypothetical protein